MLIVPIIALAVLAMVISWVMAGCLIADIKYRRSGDDTMILVALWGIICMTIGALIGAHNIMEVWKGFN